MQLVCCFVTVLLLGVSGTAAADNIRLPILGGQKFPATGQMTCYGDTFTAISCTGMGQDGEIQAGATLSFRDNGNGTITDRNTKLVWEKKSDDGSIHDVDNGYTWNEAFAVHVRTLNNTCNNAEGVDCSVNADCPGVGGKCGFAGKRDWRLPNVRELQTIINYELDSNPVVLPVFNTNCLVGVNVLTRSCTAGFNYWSSTTFTGNPAIAWIVAFNVGVVVASTKILDDHHVRAVRSGL